MPEKKEGALAPNASAEAVLNALRLVSGHVAVDTPMAMTPSLPTARSRVVIDEIAGQGTYEALDASRPNLKAMVGDALNWNGQARATKPVVRAVAAALCGDAPDAGSSYPQATEMLSFLSMCAPLLEPDRLARIAALALQTPNAYRPVRYLVRPVGQLKALLTRFPDARREQLLSSLWVTAHEGRWWQATVGRAGQGQAAAVRGRARRDQDLPAEQRAAIAEQIKAAFADPEETPSAVTLAGAFSEHLLTYSDAAVAMVKRVQVNDEEGHKLLAQHVDHPDADVPVLLSYVPGLLPDERPESPIPALINYLVNDLGEDIDSKDAMPEKPDSWPELYPGVSHDGFPMPNRLHKLSELPGLPGAEARMCRNAFELQQNADHMGNCTLGRRGECEAGDGFIGYVKDGDVEVNFELLLRRRANDQYWWRLGEINTRFNRGGVPAHIQTAVGALIAELNEHL